MDLVILGSSYNLPAHWEGGARARKNKFAAKKSVRPSEDGSAGGFKGGMPSRPSVSPAARASARSRAEKLPFPFRRKNRRAQKSKNVKAIFLRGRPPLAAAGGGAGQFSRSKKVRAKCIITAPKLTLSELIAPLAVRAADGSLRKAKSAFVFAVKSQSSLN